MIQQLRKAEALRTFRNTEASVAWVDSDVGKDFRWEVEAYGGDSPNAGVLVINQIQRSVEHIKMLR